MSLAAQNLTRYNVIETTDIFVPTILKAFPSKVNPKPDFLTKVVGFGSVPVPVIIVFAEYFGAHD